MEHLTVVHNLPMPCTKGIAECFLQVDSPGAKCYSTGLGRYLDDGQADASKQKT